MILAFSPAYLEMGLFCDSQVRQLNYRFVPVSRKVFLTLTPVKQNSEM